MAGNTQCFPLVGGKVMRVTRLDECGIPVYGACSQVVSDGFVSVASTADVTTADVIELKNANGKNCVRMKPADELNGFGLEVTFCKVDPDLFAMITGQATVTNDTGDVVGFRVNTAVDLDSFGWALEVWSNVPSEACDPAGNVAYGYVLYPYIKGAHFGDFTIENNAITFVATGASTHSGGGWDDGPYNVITDGGLPAPLADPIATDDHLHVQLTYLAPPVATCGCDAVADPHPSS